MVTLFRRHLSLVAAGGGAKALFVPGTRHASQFVEYVSPVIKAYLFDLADLTSALELFWIKFVVVLPSSLKLLKPLRICDANH
jgi:hypothetical protein